MSKYDLANKSDLNDYLFKSKYLVDNKKKVELKALNDNRTTKQNAALHKFFIFIAVELNELGLEFQYFGVKGSQLGMRYTPNIVKEFFWKPIQLALFDIESTTKLNTTQMNEVIDVITKFFSDKGVVISFPSIENN